MIIVLLILLWLGYAALTGWVAVSKQRDLSEAIGWGLIFGLFALIYYLTLPKKPTAPSTALRPGEVRGIDYGGPQAHR